LDNIKQLLKNKYFIIAIIIVSVIALIMYMKEKSSTVYYPPADGEEEVPSDYSNDQIETGNNLWDVLNQFLPGPSDDYMDVTSEHYEGEVASESAISEFFQGNIPAYVATWTEGGYKWSKHFVWHYNGQSWVLVLKSYIIGEVDEADFTDDNGDGGDSTPAPKPKPTPKPTPKPKPATKKYVTVVKWKSSNTPWNSTLWGIANHYGISLSKLLSFPENKKYRSNPNLIHPGDKVRYK
jgi:hypothetical protein